MALAAHRCNFQQLITLALQITVVTAVFAGLANGAGKKEAVKYMYDNMIYDVQYGGRYHIQSSRPTDGGLRSWSNGDMFLDQNVLGEVVKFVRVSGSTSLNNTVYENDIVWITSVDQFPPAINPGWGWRHDKSRWVLTRTSSSKGLAKFKIIPTPGNSEQTSPPKLFYYLQSCPGNYCSGLTRFKREGVTYVKLGNKGSEYGDLSIMFYPNIK